MKEFDNYICSLKYPVLKSRPNLKGYDGEIQRGYSLGIIYVRPPQQKNGVEYQDCGRLKWACNKLIFKNSCDFFDRYYPGFQYTTIQYNYCNRSAKHIDGNNVGISVIIAFGDYTGGRLIVYNENDEPEYIDIKNKFYSFNGSKYYHETEEFKGIRTSLVFFNVGSNVLKSNIKSLNNI